MELNGWNIRARSREFNLAKHVRLIPKVGEEEDDYFQHLEKMVTNLE